jgi:hypothetical protein
VRTPFCDPLRILALLGVPGTGKAHHHSSHGHHLEQMDGAEECMPQHRSYFFEEINEITLLFNCFSLAYYTLHLAPVVIPAHFSLGVGLCCHIAVLLPALLLMFRINPGAIAAVQHVANMQHFAKLHVPSEQLITVCSMLQIHVPSEQRSVQGSRHRCTSVLRYDKGNCREKCYQEAAYEGRNGTSS